MHIAEIHVGHLPPLYDLDFKCDKQVNLFIGTNSSGKSTILRAIKELHSLVIREDPPPERDGEYGRITNTPVEDAPSNWLYLNYDSVLVGEPIFALGPSDDWPQGSAGVEWNAVPFLYVPATRIPIAGTNVFGTSLRDTPTDLERAQAVNRPPFDSDYEQFNGPYVKFLMGAMPDVFKLSFRQREQFRSAIGRGYSCAQIICLEVIRGNSPQTYIETERDVFGGESVMERHHHLGVVTSDDILGDGLYIGTLSSGSQGTLLWIYALAIRMAHHYGWADGWEKRPAILLIDEIENHLHPTWQRRVIPALLEHFPGLQIFATTHSPFVVAGLRAGQVHLLKRDEYGVVTATTNTEDIVGWTADEILRNMMGVDEPTDQLTVDRANRLRQLREKESLTAEEESELAELRRQVNEALLSKEGQLGAQRERYADLMERFLLSRQSGPTQDGD